MRVTGEVVVAGFALLALAGLLGLNLRPRAWPLWGALVLVALADAWLISLRLYHAPNFKMAYSALWLAWVCSVSFTLGLLWLAWGLLRWKPWLERSPSPAPTQVSES